MLTITVNEREAVCSRVGPITAGSVGLPVRFRFSAAWDGLSRIAVFRGSGASADVALLTDECTVPAEVLAAAGGSLTVGVWGGDAGGTAVIPTVWVRAGRIEEGTEPSGIEPAAPTPSWAAQVQALAQEALEKAEAVAQAAEDGDFDGEDGQDGLSPTLSVSDIPGGHRLTITDADGTRTADVMDGVDRIFVVERRTAPHTTYADALAAYSSGRQLVCHVTISGREMWLTDYYIKTTFGNEGIYFAVPVADGPTHYYVVSNGFMDGNQMIADWSDTLSDSNWQPVQGRIIKAALDGKANSSDLLATCVTDTAAGSVASFADGADNIPVKDLTIDIDPVQDLHGYSNPWPGGGGKNLLKSQRTAASSNNITITVVKDSSDNILHYVFNGTASAAVYYDFNVVGSTVQDVPLVEGTQYIFSGLQSAGGDSSYRLRVANSGGSSLSFSGTVDGIAFTYDSSSTVIFGLRIESGYTCSNLVVKPMIRLASNPDAAFAPYANICPVTGWTGANVYAEDEYDASAAPKATISWQSAAGTVCGGTLDVTTGLLTVTRKTVDAGTLNWNLDTISGGVRRFSSEQVSDAKASQGVGVKSNLLCSEYKTVTPVEQYNGQSPYSIIVSSTSTFLIYDPDKTALSKTEFKSAVSGVQIVYELAAPLTYRLTPAEVKTLLGQNSIWADTGDSAVEYRADTKRYINKKIAALGS